MLINLEMVAREYNPAMAEYYFKDCIYNGTISECRQYLKERQKVAEHNKDYKFISLVNSMVNNGLVKYTKNSYEIAMVTDNTGFVINTNKYDRTVWFTIYRHKNNEVAYDYPYALPKYIKSYIEKLAKEI